MARERCLFILESGKQCRKHQSEDSKYCASHTALIAGSPAETAITTNVRDSYTERYQEFLKQEATDLRPEMAELRTIRAQLQELVSKSSVEHRMAFSETLKKSLLEFFQRQGVDHTQGSGISEVWASAAATHLYAPLVEFLPEWLMDRASVYLIRDLIEAASRVAERIKKIRDGYVIKLEAPIALYLQFLQVCVLPFVPSVDGQRQVIDAARHWAESFDRVQDPQYLETPADGITPDAVGARPLEEVLLVDRPRV